MNIIKKLKCKYFPKASKEATVSAKAPNTRKSQDDEHEVSAKAPNTRKSQDDEHEFLNSGPLLSKQDILSHPSFLSHIVLHDSESTITIDCPNDDSWPPSKPPISCLVHSTNEYHHHHHPEISDTPIQSTYQLNITAWNLDNLPVELFTMIAMSSGFRGCLKLRAVNKRCRKILSQKSSWAHFAERSPDAIHTKVVVETKLHQFDQFVFGLWTNPLPINSNRESSTSSGSTAKVSFSNGPSLSDRPVPFIIHRTFLEHMDFLGGLYIRAHPVGKSICTFFEHRERLSCYISDVQNRMASGDLPQVLPNEDSPVGGLRVKHSCSECQHYDTQEWIKSELILQIPPDQGSLSHTYSLDSRNKLTIGVASIGGVLGYSNDFPSVTTSIWKIDDLELSKREHSFYLEFVTGHLSL